MKKLITVCLSILLAGVCCMSFVSAYSASEAMEELRKVQDNTIWKVQDTQPIRPAERPADSGDWNYVEIRHVQDLNGLLVQCNDPAAIEGKIAGDKPVHVTDYSEDAPYQQGSYNLAKLGDYFDKNYNLREYIRGEERYAADDDKRLQKLIEDGVYIIDMSYGSDYEKEEADIIEFLTENEATELIGILQTDWYLKGYYDDWCTGINLIPPEGKTVNFAELNIPEYHNIGPEGMIRDDGLSIDEIEELCTKLEARDDIAYAWVSGVYLEDPLCNEGTASHTLDIFHLGNLDSDSEITMKDAMKVLREWDDVQNLFLPGTFTEEQKLRADVNGDGNVDMKDAMSILKYAKEVSDGYEPTWDEILGK